MGTVVLDASVLIAEFDPGDVHHRAASTAIRDAYARGDDFCVPTSVLAEILVGDVKSNGRAAAERRLATTVSAFGPSRVLDDAVAMRAAELRATHRWLRLPDALVLATALVDDADSVLTADGRWSKIDRRVQVI